MLRRCCCCGSGGGFVVVAAAAAAAAVLMPSSVAAVVVHFLVGVLRGWPVIPGPVRHDWQLPPGLGDRDLEAMVWEVHRLCSSTGPISMQQALRLVLGMAYNIEAAVAKWREVAAWREEQRMALVRERLDAMMRSNADISFPHEQEVYGKLFRGCPCALLTADGRPVSVWHAGAPRADELSSLPVEHLKEWSREVFEYADLWISKDTERTRQLTGYIQVYNMAGLGWRQVTSKEVAEKLKGALSAGGFYVEAVARIYVVNAPRVFSMAWKMVRGFLSPWTASKITVSSEVPQELIATWTWGSGFVAEMSPFGGRDRNI